MNVSSRVYKAKIFAFLHKLVIICGTLARMATLSKGSLLIINRTKTGAINFKCLVFFLVCRQTVLLWAILVFLFGSSNLSWIFNLKIFTINCLQKHLVFKVSWWMVVLERLHKNFLRFSNSRRCSTAETHSLSSFKSLCHQLLVKLVPA